MEYINTPNKLLNKDKIQLAVFRFSTILANNILPVNRALTCPHKSECLVEENKEEQMEMLPKQQTDLRLQFIHRPIKKSGTLENIHF